MANNMDHDNYHNDVMDDSDYSSNDPNDDMEDSDNSVDGHIANVMEDSDSSTMSDVENRSDEMWNYWWSTKDIRKNACGLGNIRPPRKKERIAR